MAEAETILTAAHAPRGYLPIEGIAAYDQTVQTMLFGKGSPLLEQGRVITTQAIGGTGALKVGADFLKRLLPDATVAISDQAGKTTARCLSPPVSRCATTAITTLSATALTAAACSKT